MKVDEDIKECIKNLLFEKIIKNEIPKYFTDEVALLRNKYSVEEYPFDNE